MEPRPERYNGELGTRQDIFIQTFKSLYYNKGFDTKRQLRGYGEREFIEHDIANYLGVESWKVLHKFSRDTFSIPAVGHPRHATQLHAQARRDLWKQHRRDKELFYMSDETGAAPQPPADPKPADLDKFCNAIRMRF